MDSAFIDFGRKSIIWKVYLEAVIQPLKTLGSASVGKGGMAKDFNTTQVDYSGWRQISTQNIITVSSTGPLHLHKYPMLAIGNMRLSFMASLPAVSFDSKQTIEQHPKCSHS